MNFTESLVEERITKTTNTTNTKIGEQMKNLEGDTGANRRMKHVEIIDAIRRLRFEIVRLRDLEAEISAGVVSDEPVKEELGPVPALLYVLDNAPREIYEIAEEIAGLVQSIREELF